MEAETCEGMRGCIFRSPKDTPPMNLGLIAVVYEGQIKN